MIISESNGNYSQTIRIGGWQNEVEVRINGQEIYNGIATHIIDDGLTLSFKDESGKEYKFEKRHPHTTIAI